MTREEAIAKLKNFAIHAYPNEEFLMAIRALEQEPCTDAISRQAVLDIAKSSKSNWIDNSVLFKKVNELPPVTPQYTDAEIQRMQKLEQAEIQKAYELGKADAEKVGHWIPVSERLPDKPDKYLVTVDNKYVTTGVWCGFAEDWQNVTAWMPLPEPYKASPTGAESEA